MLPTNDLLRDWGILESQLNSWHLKSLRSELMSVADVYTESKQVDEERESQDKRLRGKCHTPLFLSIPRGICNHLCDLEVNMTNMDKHDLFPIC